MRGPSDIAAKADRTPGTVLSFHVERQRFGNWCWAAIAVSVARYYGAEPLEQQDVAARVLGLGRAVGKSIARPAAKADRRARLDHALSAVGCFSHWSPGRPTPERLWEEIQDGRPIGVRVEWAPGDSHYVVVSGFHPDTYELHVDDPACGPSVQSFRTFPATYCGTGGVWGGTFWTRRPGAAPGADERSSAWASVT